MIADTFIKRPVTAIVISIVIVLIGVLSILNLPISQYPDISPPTVNISTTYNGADAQTVEQTITTPIETQVCRATVPRADRVRSRLRTT